MNAKESIPIRKVAKVAILEAAESHLPKTAQYLRLHVRRRAVSIKRGTQSGERKHHRAAVVRRVRAVKSLHEANTAVFK